MTIEENEFPRSTWRRTRSRIIWDSGDTFTWEKHYDLNGNYIGQMQANVYADGVSEPDDIFLSATIIDGKPCVNGTPVAPLTKEQLELII